MAAGRRSGKTERAKRKLLMRSFAGTEFLNPRFFAAAPTRDQAKRIFWPDLKAMVPKPLMFETPRESELTIRLRNNVEICVVGMDKPERIEGTPWDGGIWDEFANSRERAWDENVRPALADRQGWCDFVGVPEGRNHYYNIFRYAMDNDDPEWAAFTWKSADILPMAEIESARRNLDDLTFAQEFEASFVNFSGRAYYPFNVISHCATLSYNPRLPLVFCFDFNVSPGTAAVCQEMPLPNDEYGTAVIGEVWIPRDSNTPMVCQKLIEDWAHHKGRVECYGDATGGAGGSAKVQGSDWDLINQHLRPAFGNIDIRVRASNPRERERVNAVNSRLRSSSGAVRMMVDPSKAPNTVKDFEGTRILEGTAGQLDKKYDQELTHLTDAIGYYIFYHWPVRERRSGAMALAI